MAVCEPNDPRNKTSATFKGLSPSAAAKASAAASPTNTEKPEIMSDVSWF
jgi:hypothetical protein